MTRERYDPHEGIYFFKKQISGKKDGLLIVPEADISLPGEGTALTLCQPD
jgi:hypothetical protein